MSLSVVGRHGFASHNAKVKRLLDLLQSRRARFLVGTAVFWACAYFVLFSRSIVSKGTLVDETTPLKLLSCAFAFALCLAMEPVLRRTAHQSLATRVPTAAAMALLAGPAWALVARALFYPEQALLFTEEAVLDLWLDSIGLFWTFLAWASLYISQVLDEDRREQARRIDQLQMLAAEAQNRMLRYQLNPHFLFNTLHTLTALVDARESEKAEQVILALSNFLRFSLATDPAAEVTVSEEVDAQLEYLKIEQIRFGERIRVISDIAPEARSALAPGFILQPLVENAVKHAVAGSTQPVTIALSATVVDGRLRLAVVDDGRGTSATPRQRLGVGLANIGDRLRLLYGGEADMQAGARDGGGYCVALTLPFRRREDAWLAA